MTPEEQQAAVYRQLMKHPMTTTTFTIEGYKVVKQLGVVGESQFVPAQYSEQLVLEYKQSSAEIFHC